MEERVKDDGVECEICYDTGIVFNGKTDYLACICNKGKELSLKSGGKLTKIGEKTVKKEITTPIYFEDEEDVDFEDMMRGLPYPEDDIQNNDEEGEYD